MTDIEVVHAPWYMVYQKCRTKDGMSTFKEEGF